MKSKNRAGAPPVSVGYSMTYIPSSAAPRAGACMRLA
jgi:hypothetical protein